METTVGALRSLLALFLVAAMSICAHGAPAETADFCVAPDGDDSAAGTVEAPFATLARARDAVRKKIAAGLSADVLVYVRGGTYRIAEPVVFGPQDSGTKKASVTYAAYPNEKPTISGGRRIDGWKTAPDGTWIATAPPGASSFRELFVNGRRAQRARNPNSGYFRLVKAGKDGRTSFEFKPGDMRAWKDVKNVEVVYLHDWSSSRVLAASVDEETNVVTLAQAIGASHGFFRICGFEPHPRYFLENSSSFLDAPGEWHLDEQTGVVAYRPLPGETLESIDTVAPVATSLLEVRGDVEGNRPVTNLHFVGLRFEHCAFAIPDGGYAGIQAGYHANRSSQTATGWRILPPAVLFDFTVDCRFADGVVANVGASGIAFGRSCRDNVLAGTHITDAAGNGVLVGEERRRASDGSPWWQEHPEQATSGTVIENCLIERCGREFYGSVGIWVGLANRTRIAHNEIRWHPYTGVSVGWMWNPTPTPCKENTVENNHIHHVMQVLSDGGGIYTLGRQPGTVLRGNVIHDVPINLGRAESNGMFLDEGTTDMVIEKNVIYNIDRSPLRFHKATVNLVRDNVLVVGKGVPPVRYNATDPKNIELRDNTVREMGLQPPYRDRLLRSR